MGWVLTPNEDVLTVPLYLLSSDNVLHVKFPITFNLMLTLDIPDFFETNTHAIESEIKELVYKHFEPLKVEQEKQLRNKCVDSKKLNKIVSICFDNLCKDKNCYDKL